ncbi:MAG TPA: phosphoribosylformylglycinamidine synthase subunit PurQ [Candidatus Obscuribacter sp.]|nr:phosphoribosylformylglycinamidine synthase subunit PurQ [Candidatus Obscuribacter sp.]
MTKPDALVLRGDGINCEEETVYALKLSQFNPVRVTCLDLKEQPTLLKRAQVIVFPGGFSFGDEVRSGKVLAVKLRAYLQEALQEYTSAGRLMLGICNGFQVLVQLGILPSGRLLLTDGERPVTLAHNSGGKFLDRWVKLSVAPQATGFFAGMGGSTISLPVRHGEGRLVLRQEEDGSKIAALSPLRYESDINGSYDRIAALLSEKGNILGLMPHPECFVRTSQHPQWTSLPECEPDGLKLFTNMRAMLN